MTRQADYGIVLLAHFAGEPAGALYTARDLARETRIPLPTVSKVLKSLARGGLLASQRGARGGYELAHPPSRITLDQIVTALEGPIAMTECSPAGAGSCEHEPQCPARSSLQRVNQIVRDALRRTTLAEVVQAPTGRGPRMLQV